MLLSRVFSRVSGVRGGGRRSLLLLSPKQQLQLVPAISNGVEHHLIEHVSNFNQPSAAYSSLFRSFGFASSAEPEEGNGEAAKPSGDHVEDGAEDSVADESKEPDSGSESDDAEDAAAAAFSDLSKDDLLKLVIEKDELLKSKQQEFETNKDKFLRALADNANVMERTKREAENSKKYAIQNFAKGLLDVADNLARASSVFKESFSKIDTSNDSAGVVPLVKSLSEGVDMTEKQLGEVFKKFGLEKFDPTNEPFDPHRHNAVFQVPDASKPPGTVAHVLKAGYMLHERVVRPAEVGVTQEAVKETEE